jgi:putative FmdB family regulatory protein
MPTYDYRCSACEHEFELVQSMRAPVKKKCPACGKLQLERLIGVGAGFIIKGGAASAKAEAAEKTKDEQARQKASEASSSTTQSDKPKEGASGPAEAAPGEGKATPPTPEKKSEPAKDPAPEKKISGSTSTPTHQAREGRGVGNLVDAAKRRSREASPSKPAAKKKSRKKSG